MNEVSAKYFIPHVLLLVCLTIPAILNAQTLQRMEVERISPENSDSGLIVLTQYPDKAAIIIESEVDNLRFQSNMQGILETIEPGPGRYILAVEPVTQIIRINADGFVQKRVRIGNPRPGDRIFYSVYPEASEAGMLPVFFGVSPAEAKLYLNQREIETNAAVELSPGTYELRLEHDGYQSIQDDIKVNTQNVFFRYSMQATDIAPVMFRTNVSEGRVIVDGTERGQLDNNGELGIFLYPGEYDLSVQSDGFITLQERIEIEANRQNRFQFQLQRNSGELRVTTTPADAAVLLNGRRVQQGRDAILAPGRYLLEVEKDGYQKHNETLVIELNERIRRNIELEQLTGGLRFNTSPFDSRAELRSEAGRIVREWQGAEVINNLPVGNYEIVVDAEGYDRQRRNIRIEEGRLTDVNIRLREIRNANLRISSNATDAPGKLLKNGRVVREFEGSAHLRNLPFGDYILEFPEHEEFKAKTERISLTEGQRAHQVYIRRVMSPVTKIDFASIGAYLSSEGAGAIWNLLEMRTTFGLEFGMFKGYDFKTSNIFWFGYYIPLKQVYESREICVEYRCNGLGLSVVFNPLLGIPESKTSVKQNSLIPHSMEFSLKYTPQMYFEFRLGYRHIFPNADNEVLANDLAPGLNPFTVSGGPFFSLKLGLMGIGRLP